MSSPKAPILEVCDQVAKTIHDKWAAGPWAATMAGGKVERMYLPVNAEDGSGVVTPITDVEKLDGRRVYVYPKAFGQKDTVSRKKDLMAFAVGVQVYEVFDWQRQTAGVPSSAWCDERVTFVHDLYQWLSNPRRTGIAFTGALVGAYPDEGAVDLVFDPTMLRKQKVFWSVLSFTYCLEVTP